MRKTAFEKNHYCTLSTDNGWVGGIIIQLGSSAATARITEIIRTRILGETVVAEP